MRALLAGLALLGAAGCAPGAAYEPRSLTAYEDCVRGTAPGGDASICRSWLIRHAPRERPVSRYQAPAAVPVFMQAPAYAPPPPQQAGATTCMPGPYGMIQCF